MNLQPKATLEAITLRDIYGTLAVVSLIALITAMAAIVALISTLPMPLDPVSDRQALGQDRLAVLQAAATHAARPALSLTVTIPRNMTAQIPAALSDAGDHRGWLFQTKGNQTRVTLPAGDLSLLNQASGNTAATLSALRRAPTMPTNGPLATANVEWALESHPQAHLAYYALAPAMLGFLLAAMAFMQASDSRPILDHLRGRQTVVEKVDFSRNDQENLPIRRPNSTRRLRPGIAPGNTELVPTQATPQA